MTAALPTIRRARGEAALRERDGYVVAALAIYLWVAAQSTATGWTTMGAFMLVGAAFFLVERVRTRSTRPR